MKSIARFALAISAAATFLTGCGGSEPMISASGGMMRSGGFVPQASEAKTKGPNLYVLSTRYFNAGSGVKIYAPGRTKPMRTISEGVSNPVHLAFDSSGDLYVANAEALHGKKWGPATITVYAPGSSSPSETISQGVNAPSAMAFDHEGNLYVIMGGADRKPESVAVYAPGSTKVLRRITAGLDVPTALAFDQSDELFVANYIGKTVTVYAPGSASVLRKIHVRLPSDLVFSNSGDLYVTSERGEYSSGSIKVFAPGAASPHRSIPTTYGVAYALRWDGSGHLYALEQRPRDAAYAVAKEYAKDGSVIRTISQHLLVPMSEAFDSSGNLYVANCPRSCDGLTGRDAVRVYAPGHKSPLRTIYVHAPLALAFGP
jgi:sugar lactone lactonase YvrE